MTLFALCFSYNELLGGQAKFIIRVVYKLNKHGGIVENVLKENKANITKETILKNIGMLVVSFFFSFQNTMGDISPFGFAILSATKVNLIPSSLLGCILGYIFNLNPNLMTIRYIATIIAITVVSLSLHSMNFIKNGRLASPLIAFFCCLATGLTVVISQGFNMYSFLLIVAESVIAGGSAYFLSMTFNLTSIKRGLFAVSSYELAGIVVCISILLMSLSVIEIKGFSPARMICVLIILICSYFAREAGGSITGVTFGLVIGLACKSQELVIGYAFGGLLAGVFAPLGAVGVCCAFLIAHGVSIILSGLTTEVAIQFAEAVVATIIFLFLPKRLMEKIRLMFSCASVVPSIDGIRHSIVSRLSTASDSITELSTTVNKVSTVLAKKNTTNTAEDLYKRVQTQVCADCGNKKFCWEQCFEDSMNVFNDMYTILRDDNKITTENIPKHFESRCIKLTSLIDTFNQSYGTHTAKIATDARLSQMRSIVAQQFNSMSNLLTDLSNEFSDERTYDNETATRVSALLQEFGIVPIEISCLLDRYSRMRIEVRCQHINTDVDSLELTQKISELCGHNFEMPTVTILDSETLINFCQRAYLDVACSCTQHKCKDEHYCGDYYESFFDGKGRFIIIISDGMGTGSLAAVDSTMTASLFSQLIRSGFGFECALKIINSALMIKSSDESLSTLDLVCIDLFSGVADFYKAGAAATLVKHGKKISKLEKVALPLGILSEVEFTHSRAHLKDGDVIIMASDGAWVENEEFIYNDLKEDEEKNANKLSQKIADDALSMYKDDTNDDITVISAILKKNQ